MKIVQSGSPAGEVVPLELLKKHVRIADDAGDYSDDDDTILTQYLAAATEWVQDVCGTILLTTEFTATGKDFCLSFEGYPNPEIQSVTYLDPLGVPGTITEFDILCNRLVVPNAPQVSAVTVAFKAGIGSGNIPIKLRQAVLQLAEVFYDKSGDGPPDSVRAMIAPHRSFAF